MSDETIETPTLTPDPERRSPFPLDDIKFADQTQMQNYSGNESVNAIIVPKLTIAC